MFFKKPRRQEVMTVDFILAWTLEAIRMHNAGTFSAEKGGVEREKRGSARRSP
jgi:hypothetical protein